MSIPLSILAQEESTTVRRGNELRGHILFTAKDVFLEMGFQRASMDLIAARSDTTKRTLYVHFENKESLFLAVFELVRDLLLSKLKMPAEYADDPVEALVLFCGRFQEMLRWGRAIRMCRLSIAEAERFPEGSIRFYEAIFGTAQKRVEQFLPERFGLSKQQSAQIAEEIFSRVLHPGFTRALFGVEPVAEEWLDDDAISPNFDLTSIRSAIAGFVRLPEGHRGSPQVSRRDHLGR
jgi:AcrR family transcriptional regulator